ncbi:MAG: hypothetical protein K8R44_01810, partial [Sulfurimonas sp.]|nr:hypothetical protein [Sulfurimonas sp.]
MGLFGNSNVSLNVYNELKNENESLLCENEQLKKLIITLENKKTVVSCDKTTSDALMQIQNKHLKENII